MVKGEVKFSCEMVEFKKHANFVKNGTGSAKTDMAALLIKFELKGDKLSMFSADKEKFCRTEMRVHRHQDSDDGDYAVMGQKIEKLIAQVESEQISFTADEENLEVQTGFLVVNFETYDTAVLRTAEDAITNVDMAQLSSWSMPREILDEALSCAKSCTTSNTLRPDIAHVEVRGGKVLSSDGRKVMLYSSKDIPEKMSLKVPSGVLADVTGAVKHIDSDTVLVAEGSSYYFIRSGVEYLLGVRKVERSFHAIEGKLSKIEDVTDEIAIDKALLEAMIKGVSLGLASEEVGVQLELRGSGREAKVEISSKNAAGRKSYEYASCSRKQEGVLAFPVSFKHLLDTLSVFKGDSVVDMVVMHKKNVLMIRDKTENREVLTVIPFRTQRAVEEENKEKELLRAARTKQTEEGKTIAAEAVTVG